MQAGCLKIRPDSMSWARYDLKGRWKAALVRGVTYRRSLCGDVLAITGKRVGEDRLHDVAAVPTRDAQELSATLTGWAAAALPRLEGLLAAIASRAASYDVAALARDAAEFAHIYVGKPIVPADMARAVPVQATVGCAYNRCTFCAFYRGTAFRTRSPQDFNDHLQAVRQFMGESLEATRGIFLGDASGLLMPFSRLASVLSDIRGQFADESFPKCLPQHHWNAPRHAVSCFCDAFVTPLHRTDELIELARLGLHRVYVGVESGCDRLLRFLQKPATAASALALVERLKSAGLLVSVILMTGAGGRAHAVDHLRDTVSLLSRMPLDAADGVVFSEFFPLPGSAYVAEAEAAGIEPLSRQECRQQMRDIIHTLGLNSGHGQPHVQMYDVRQLVY